GFPAAPLPGVFRWPAAPGFLFLWFLPLLLCLLLITVYENPGLSRPDQIPPYVSYFSCSFPLFHTAVFWLQRVPEPFSAPGRHHLNRVAQKKNNVKRYKRF